MTPKLPSIPVDQPGGRLRIANLMALFNVSHATIYRWINNGSLPSPDAWYGRTPYWLNETIRPYLGALDMPSRKQVHGQASAEQS